MCLRPCAPESQIVEKLFEWGYDVFTITASELAALTADDYAQYDFAFLSETPNSSDFAPLRGHPLPIFTTEAWGCAKPPVLGWAASQVVRNIDPEPILIEVNKTSSLSDCCIYKMNKG